MEAGLLANVWALQTVRRLWADFMAREPGTLRGEDPEQLHRMRVAHRRLRTAVNSFAPVLPAELVATAPDLRWIGRELSEVRDLDVHLDTMREAAAELHADATSVEQLIAALESEHDRARERMLQTLTSSRFEQLVLRVSRVLREHVPESSIRAFPTIAEYAPAMLRQRYRRLRRVARRLTSDSNPDEVHRARRRARRLRFAAEFVEALYGEPARDLIDALTDLQDLFGKHQDSYAAIDLRKRARPGLTAEALDLARQLDQRDLKRAASLRKAGPDAVNRVRKRWRTMKRTLRESPGSAGD